MERTFDIHHNNVAGPGSYFFSFIGETSERAENSWRRHVVAAHPGLWSLVATTRRPVPTNKADAVCAGSSAQSHASRRAPRNLVRDVIRQTAGTSEQPHYFPLLLFPWRFSATRMYIRLTASPPGLSFVASHGLKYDRLLSTQLLAEGGVGALSFFFCARMRKQTEMRARRNLIGFSTLLQLWFADGRVLDDHLLTSAWACDASYHYPCKMSGAIYVSVCFFYFCIHFVWNGKVSEVCFYDIHCT